MKNENLFSLVNDMDIQLGNISYENWKEEKAFITDVENILREPVGQLNINKKFHFVNIHYLSPSKTKEKIEKRTVFYIYQHSDLSRLIGDYKNILSLYDQELVHFCSLMIKHDWNKELVFRFILSSNRSMNNKGDFISIPESVSKYLLEISLDKLPNDLKNVSKKNITNDLKKISEQLCRSVRCTDCNCTGSKPGSKIIKELFGSFNLTLRGLKQNIGIFRNRSEIYAIFSPIAIRWDNRNDVIAVLVGIPTNVNFDRIILNTYRQVIRNIHHKELMFINKQNKIENESKAKEEKRKELLNEKNSIIDKIKAEKQKEYDAQNGKKIEQLQRQLRIVKQRLKDAENQSLT